MKRLVLSTLCLFAFWLSHAFVMAQDHVPFIAGYDRFGKHHEIEDQQSGALLIRDLSCTACHASEDPYWAAKRGPILDDVASRLRLDWVERFLIAPHRVKPGTTMPDVLANRQADRQKVARAITAFLSTLNATLPEVKGSGLIPVPHEFWNLSDNSLGEQLYHNVGCVACHAILRDHNQADGGTSAPQSALDKLLDQLEPDQLSEMGLTGAARTVASVPLGVLHEKYTRQGLTLFLLDPLRTRPAGRMPSLKLAPVEAANIAGFLLMNDVSANAGKAPSSQEFTIEEIAQGRKWFTELQCVNCHAAKGLKTSTQATPLAKLETDASRACLSPSSPRSVQFELAQDQIASIQSAIRSIQHATVNTNATTEQQLQAHLLSFNCYACHSRGDIGGVGRYRRDHFSTVGNIDLGDEGRFPPPLDHVGRKLQTTWLKNVLLGKKADVRPHLQIRMPVFNSDLSQTLPQLLATVDKSETKRSLQSSATPKLNAKDLAEVGSQLMDTACVQCHAFNGNTLPGVVGVDLHAIDGRIQADWFGEFLADPGRLKARTRMPNFFPDGKSQRPDLLEGNVDMQIAAMWAYLTLKSPGLPSKIKEARDRDYELKPTDKPILLRTFMKQAGTHAIAVGFPEKVHYAFDAEHLRLAVGWQGKFLDAQGTWFVRLAPPAEPLGESIVQIASSVPFANVATNNQPWPTDMQGYRFKGYRLDAGGTPTFLYQFNQIEIEDRISPLREGGLRRHWKLLCQGQDSRTIRLSWLVHAGKELNMTTANSAVDEQKLQVSLTQLGSQSVDSQIGSIRINTDRQDWIVPIEFQQSIQLVTEYRW